MLVLLSLRRLVAVAALALTFTFAAASSTARHPLAAVDVAHNPTILTPSHRVTALSVFDVAFDLSGTRVRLSLEPNHNVIADGAMVRYLGADGEVVRHEPIARLDHKVFKGTAWLKRGVNWDRVGWARITVRRDGIHPLFEGAFTVQHDHHHIHLASNYQRTKHELDPSVDESEDESMVVFRDSDMTLADERIELKGRASDAYACTSDQLEFNLMPDHPVYAAMAERKGEFGVASLTSLFGKRQIDNPTGGNSAGMNLAQTIGSTSGCPTTRKVALVGVATDCTYTGSFNSTESVRQNIINQLNSASNVYEGAFNLSLGLANLTISDASCPTSPQTATPWNQACSSSVDIQARLNLFSGWRATQKDSNSHWTLLSTCNTGEAVGLSWLGQACVQGSQSSNSSDGGQETVAGANVVVRTSMEWEVIAHETGHMFGAVHDCTSDTCSDKSVVSSQQCCPLSASTCDGTQAYIMNPASASNVKTFSACTVGNICSAMLRNSVKTSCLTDNRDVMTITGQQCGNGIVESGEDCDCGGTAGCGDNPCCDPTTCKFKSGAVCDDSNEDCCSKCQLASASTVCRPSTGSCDPEERCTGSTATCPTDQTRPDGSGCGHGLKCASGQCTSRSEQCKTVMGSYTQNNDTHACDDVNCMLSCASPEFGSGICYGLQQYFLNGSPCSGGTCQGGQCKGGSVGKEIKSWLDRHKPLAIGLGSAIGALLLFSLLGCLFRCCSGRRKVYPSTAAAAAAGQGGPQYRPWRGDHRALGSSSGDLGAGGAANTNRQRGAPQMSGQHPPYPSYPAPPPPTWGRGQWG